MGQKGRLAALGQGERISIVLLNHFAKIIWLISVEGQAGPKRQSTDTISIPLSLTFCSVQLKLLTVNKDFWEKRKLAVKQAAERVVDSI